MESETMTLLKEYLQKEIPNRIENLKREPIEVVMMQDRSMSEILTSLDAKEGLAEVLACLAFSPYGVDFMDLHFEAKHPQMWGDGDSDGK